MAAVPRDPNFWRRFSVAVHQDEESKRPELKHSYVTMISPSMPSPTAARASTVPNPDLDPASPLSTSPISPSLGPISPSSSQSSTSPLQSLPSPIFPSSQNTPYPHPQPLSSAPLSRTPSKLTKSKSNTKAPTPITLPKPKPTKSKNSTRPFSPNPSTLTLGLACRPPSRFKFHTSITANHKNRESWLEEQRRKKSKRTCMCWCFWVVLLGVVAGIVVAIIVLRDRGIL